MKFGLLFISTNIVPIYLPKRLKANNWTPERKNKIKISVSKLRLRLSLKKEASGSNKEALEIRIPTIPIKVKGLVVNPNIPSKPRLKSFE